MRELRNQVSVLAAALCIALGSTPANSQRAAGLRILLTNDDGFDATGLKAMKAALVAAGHRVTVIAPAENQSNAGTRASATPVKVEQKADDTWAIHGSPVDSVNIAIRHLLRDNPPDLVVSGINQGPNLGPALVSGTVGAAAFASAHGFPAIGVSAGLRADEATAQPTPYPSTLTAYGEAARVVVRLVSAVCFPRCDRAMSSGVIINVNHPALPAAEIKDVLFLPPGGEQIGKYVQSGTDLRYQAEPVACENSTKNDTAAFVCGYATVTVLTASRQIESSPGRALSQRLRKLALRNR